MPLVSDTVLNIRELQNQQNSVWEAVQRNIGEVKKTVSSIQSGNDKLKAVPAGTPCRVFSLDELVWMFITNRVLVIQGVAWVLFSGFGRGQ